MARGECLYRGLDGERGSSVFCFDFSIFGILECSFGSVEMGFCIFSGWRGNGSLFTLLSGWFEMVLYLPTRIHIYH